MKNPLKNRSLLTLFDYTDKEIRYLLDISLKVKQEKKAGKLYKRFAGKSLAMLFEKRSTRTRCAFETAFGEDGGHPVFLGMEDIQLGKKESIEDTARVLGRMFDAIEFRGFKQTTVETLSQYSGVPVYNGLTDQYHPTQALADVLTVEEYTGALKGKKIAFLGDGRNNVATSLLIISAKMGVKISIVCPSELTPNKDVVKRCEEIALSTESNIEVTDDIEGGLKNSDAVYTDVWASMGEEAKMQERMALLSPYRVTTELMSATGKASSIFLHCLPAVKGNEVTHEVIEGNQSAVWDQAENRKHTIKALMLATLLDNPV